MVAGSKHKRSKQQSKHEQRTHTLAVVAYIIVSATVHGHYPARRALPPRQDALWAPEMATEASSGFPPARKRGRSHLW